MGQVPVSLPRPTNGGIATMPRMLCAPCGVELRCEQNEVIVSTGDALWYADLYRCPACGHQTIAGFGLEPFKETWRHDIPAYLARLSATERVFRQAGSLSEGPYEPAPTDCPEGGSHSRVEAGTCTKCGEPGEVLT
mgnify:CR=1 FL=1